jgi:uncharacterized protein YbcI
MVIDQARSPERGSAALEISNGMVQLLARVTGRGPTKARTTIGRDNVFVMLADTLTIGERSLVAAGFGDHVLETRSRYQSAMRHEAVFLIETIMRRKVVGFMSDNHLDPDLACEIFALEPGEPAQPLQEGDSAE